MEIIVLISDFYMKVFDGVFLWLFGVLPNSDAGEIILISILMLCFFSFALSDFLLKCIKEGADLQ